MTITYINVLNIDPDFITEEMYWDALEGFRGVSLQNVYDNLELDISGCFMNILCIERDHWTYHLNTEDNALNLVIEYYDVQRPELDSKQVCIEIRQDGIDFEYDQRDEILEKLAILDIYETVTYIAE